MSSGIDCIDNNKSSLSVVVAPFPVLQITNALPKDICEQFTDLISGLTMDVRNCDLFSFLQSTDLISTAGSHPVLAPFRSCIFQENIKKWFNIPDLEDDPYMSIQLYPPGSYLLPHDDATERRIVSFVYYAHEEWDHSQGGQLELYERDSSNVFPNPAVRVDPLPNSMIIFPVMKDISYHSVSLVHSGLRISLQGWFSFKPGFERPERYTFKSICYTDWWRNSDEEGKEVLLQVLSGWRGKSFLEQYKLIFDEYSVWNDNKKENNEGVGIPISLERTLEMCGDKRIMNYDLALIEDKTAFFSIIDEYLKEKDSSIPLKDWKKFLKIDGGYTGLDWS